MGIIYQIRLSAVVLSVFMILVACDQTPYPHLQDEEDGSSIGSTSSDDEEFGSSSFSSPCRQMPLSVAVLPWPPYVENDSDGWQSKVIEELRDMTDLVNITFRKVSSESELQKLFKSNETDIGFPLIKSPHDSIPDDNLKLKNHTGLDFLVAPLTQSPGEVCIETLLQSWPLLALSLILTGMAGILIWLLEMIGNREEFPKTFARGSWEGFWWAFISMTTVGYGDKIPRSLAGRCFAIIWIFIGLIIVAVFMANVTTALTSISVKPEYKISEGEVGVVSGSLEETIAENNNGEVKAYKNYDELMAAFRKREVWKIVIDSYTASKRLLNEKATFRHQIFHIKHFSLPSYQVIANISQSNLEKPWHDEGVKCILNCIKSAMNKCLAGLEIKSLQGINNSSSSTKYSFNLFANSNKELKKATYISLAILAGLIFVGLLVDNTFWKIKSSKIEEYELKVCEDQDIRQEIAKGKELLKELQLLYQKLEQKINSNPALKLKKSENFSSIHSKNIDS